MELIFVCGPERQQVNAMIHESSHQSNSSYDTSSSSSRRQESAGMTADAQASN